MLIDSGAWIGHAHDRRLAGMLASQNITVFQYHFAHVGHARFVPHASELSYVFQQCGQIPTALAHSISCQGAGLLPSKQDLILQQNIGTFWTNFARHGYPTTNSTAWPRYNSSEDVSIVLDSPLSLEKAYRAEADAFWRAQ